MTMQAQGGQGRIGVVGVLATDGGPHPGEKWGEMTAKQIIEIAPESHDAEAKALFDRIVGVMTHHHRLNQDHERAELASAISRLDAPMGEADLERAVAATWDVIRAGDGTRFRRELDERKDFIARVVAKDFATAMLIERDWFAQRNCDLPQAAEYLIRRQSQQAA